MGKELTAEQRDFINRFIAKTTSAPSMGDVDYKRLGQSWDAARRQTEDNLKRLEQSILVTFAGALDLDEVCVRVRKLDLILETVDGDLQDTLDAALHASDTERPAIHRDALSVIGNYREYLVGDEFVSAVQDNPHSVDVLGALLQALADLAAALAI